MPKSFVFILENNWQAISNYTTGQIALTASALGDLKKKIPFNQLRFHCFKKIPGRTFHVVTMKNTLGDDVVKYFTAQTDSFPKSCGSFYSLPDDNSMLSKSCWRWKDGYWSAVQPVLTDEKFRLVDMLHMFSPSTTGFPCHLVGNVMIIILGIQTLFFLQAAIGKSLFARSPVLDNRTVNSGTLFAKTPGHGFSNISSFKQLLKQRYLTLFNASFDIDMPCT